MNYVVAGTVFAMIHDAVGPQLEDLMIVDYYPEGLGGAPAVYTIMATPKSGQSTHITDCDDGRRFIERMRRSGQASDCDDTHRRPTAGPLRHIGRAHRSDK